MKRILELLILAIGFLLSVVASAISYELGAPIMAVGFVLFSIMLAFAANSASEELA